MYYTGLDPRTMQPVYVPKDPREKAMQRALMQYKDPKNYKLVHEALELAHREDLIGFGPQCLIRPRKGETASEKADKKPAKKPPQKPGKPAAKRSAPALDAPSSKKSASRAPKSRKPSNEKPQSQKKPQAASSKAPAGKPAQKRPPRRPSSKPKA